MKLDFLQIGFNKCGTTFLDRNVYPLNPHIQCLQAINYLDLGRLLLKKFIFQDGLEYDRKTFESEFNEICDSLFTKKSAVVKGIMFEPFTFVYERRFDRKSVIDRIHDSFPDVKIIMPIRNQETWILSHYSQYLKSGGLLGFHDFIESFFQNPILDSHYIDWYPLVSYLFEVFGPARVLVYLYEDLRISPQGTADRIFSFLNVPSVKIDEGVVNPSLSRQALFIRRFLNHFVRFDAGASSYGFQRDLFGAKPSPFSRGYWLFAKGYKTYTNKLCYSIDRVFGFRKRINLNQAQKERIKNRYSANNRKLSEILEIDLSKHGYP